MSKFKDDELFWLNDMRFLAAVAIIFVHISQGVMKLSESKDSLIWWSTNIYQSISYWGVPVFVMISGALLLNPKKVYIDNKEFYKKRVNRLLAPIIFWSIVYIFWSYLKSKVTNTPYGVNDILSQLLTGTPYYHLWYIYMVLGLYLIAPYLRKIIKYSTKSELLVVVFLVMFLSVISVYSNNGEIKVIIFLQKFPYYIGYFILGYIIMDSKFKIPTKYFIAIFILSIFLTATLAYIIENPYLLYNNFSPTMILTAVSLMYIIKNIHKKISINKDIIEKLASFSLGAYLIHPLILSVIKKFNYFYIDLNKYAFIAIPFLVFILIVFSLIIAYFLSKVPYLKRTI